LKSASIVGAGLAGLSLAVELARLGVEVTVYDHQPPGYGATGRSAGILVTILPPSLLPLALESLDFYRGLPGAKGHWAPRQAFWVAPEGCGGPVIEAHRRAGLPAGRAGDPSRALGVDFRLRGGEEAWIVREYLVDTGWVPGALAAMAEGLGVRLVEARVERRGDWYYVGGDPLEGTVIVAAGAWTGLLAPEAARLLRVYRCQAATARGAAPRLIVEDDVAGYYLVPFGGEWYNIGDGSNTILDDPEDGFRPDLEDTLEVLERYAGRVEAAWEARLEQYWSAPCSVGIDGYPLAARVGDVYVFTGLDGAGVSLGPALARRMARHLVQGSPMPEWAARLDREPASRWPAEPYDVCMEHS